MVSGIPNTYTVKDNLLNISLSAGRDCIGGEGLGK